MSGVGPDLYDPTGFVPQVAFLLDEAAEPGDADWHTGSWRTDAAGDVWVGALVGPNGGVIDLSTEAVPCSVWLWARWSGPDSPVVKCGSLPLR